MIDIVGKVLSATKKDGTYDTWMRESFEANHITNIELANTLKKMLLTQDIFATTNYDLLLEEATGLGMVTYDNPAVAYSMLDRHASTYVIHIHGAYDSNRGIDNIIADNQQYEAVIANEGAQFIQNILGTRTIVFVGCGKTTEDGNISRFIQFANKHLKMDKEYYFLYRLGETIDGMPDNIKLIPYGDEYDDLPMFLEDMAQTRIKSKIESNPLILRTVYSNNKADTYGLSQYYFANEYLKFCGRNVEIAQLLNFIEMDRNISWWAVTGQAGAGKSRLAYELLHRIPNNIFGFFLNYNTNSSLVDKFEPFTDTLVIIDYVKGNEKRVAEFVSSLIDKYKPLEYKLRILFLERDNLLLSGSWFDKLMESFDFFHRGIFLDSEYNADISLRRHRFLYLDDLDINAVLELIGEICSKKDLPSDKYRDCMLRDDYAKKFEQLKFRPLFLQLYVEAWVENGYVQVEYRNYTELLDIIIRREQERILNLVEGETDTCNALLRLIVRANISGTLSLMNIPELYKSDWERVKVFAKSHTLSGIQRTGFIQTIISDATQEIIDCSNVIQPQYPDIIKEYMFLSFIDDNEIAEISDELWMNCPHEYNLFLNRCILDFHDNEMLTTFIRNTSADYCNINALQVRLALLQNKIVHSIEDGPRLLELNNVEYKFWREAPIDENSSIEQKMLQLQGYYYSAEQFCGWSEGIGFFEAVQKIAEYYNEPELISFKVSYLMEFAHYLTDKNEHVSSNKICDLIEPLIQYMDNDEKKMDAWLSLQRERVVNLVFERKWKHIDNIHKQMFDNIDWENEKQVELYAYIWFSATQKCYYIMEWQNLLEYSYYLQDLAEDYGGQTRKIYFNDKVHYYYLHAKVISTEAVSIGSTLSGIGYYGISVVDSLIKEIESNMMISDFSGLLVAAKALKVGMDDSVTDDLVNDYFIEADALIERYPDNPLLAEKTMDLWKTSYEEQYKTLVPKCYVDKGYAFALRFSNNRDVIGQFFELLKVSTEVSNWNYYVQNKQIVSHLIEFEMNDYLLQPFIEQKTVKRIHAKIGANDLCPCGSGKKFKKCCRGNGKYDW
jgi:hypothetical protein